MESPAISRDTAAALDAASGGAGTGVEDGALNNQASKRSRVESNIESSETVEENGTTINRRTDGAEEFTPRRL